MILTRKKVPLLIFSLALPLVSGLIGSLFTTSSIASWYAYLAKPPFTPPNWAFGPVWTALYILMGTAFYLVAIQKQNIQRTKAIRIYFVQLFLNFIWSIIFFGSQSILGGLIIILAMWVAIFLTIFTFEKVSKVAALLLIPYLVWVSLATYLNLSLLLLNP